MGRVCQAPANAAAGDEDAWQVATPQPAATDTWTARRGQGGRCVAGRDSRSAIQRSAVARLLAELSQVFHALSE